MYVTYFNDVKIYPLPHRIEAHKSLYWYFMDYGVPENLQSDNAWIMNKRNKRKKVIDKEGGIKVSQTEPHSPSQNKADWEIHKSQKLSLRQMSQYDAHLKLWDKELMYHAKILSRMARSENSQI